MQFLFRRAPVRALASVASLSLRSWSNKTNAYLTLQITSLGCGTIQFYRNVNKPEHLPVLFNKIISKVVKPNSFCLSSYWKVSWLFSSCSGKKMGAWKKLDLKNLGLPKYWSRTKKRIWSVESMDQSFLKTGADMYHPSISHT